jgi:hypothetical protein
MKGKSTRGKHMHAILSCKGFSDMVVHTHGFAITVPQTSLSRAGVITKAVGNALKNIGAMSLEDAMAMNDKYGVEIIKEAM